MLKYNKCLTVKLYGSVFLLTVNARAWGLYSESRIWRFNTDLTTDLIAIQKLVICILWIWSPENRLKQLSTRSLNVRKCLMDFSYLSAWLIRETLWWSGGGNYSASAARPSWSPPGSPGKSFRKQYIRVQLRDHTRSSVMCWDSA